MPLLVATSNPGKLAEFRHLLTGIHIVGLSDMGLSDLQVDEHGETFRDNALHKAQVYAQAANCIAIADDSGLEVDALGGAPGVHSARFGTADLDDTGRCQLLLERLQGVPDADRSARFRCHLVACPPEGHPLVESDGVCEGRIMQQLHGSGGFGYDPVFLLPDLGSTMAQISAAEKNQISHRGRAIGRLRSPLHTTFPELLRSR